jgi:hypothetical protein
LPPQRVATAGIDSQRISEGAGTPMPSPGLFARKVKNPLTGKDFLTGRPPS